MPLLTEADTCRRYVLPKLYAAGWNDDQISEQKSFTDGRIVVAKKKKTGNTKPGYWRAIFQTALALYALASLFPCN